MISNEILIAAGNQIAGTSGDDRLYGSDDEIDGRYGENHLSGGGGADTFRFRQAAPGDQGGNEPPADRVTDFNSAESDHFDLSRIDADTSADGNQAFHFIGAGDFTGAVGQLRVVTPEDPAFEDYVQIEGDVDGDGAGDFIM